MSYIGIIVESPAKCSKIESFLKGYNGKLYKCIATYGHLRELNGLKSIDIKNHFHPTYQTIKKKNKQIYQLKQFISYSSEILLATDDDREGEAIAWHVCKMFDLPIERTKRIIFHEITKSSLQYAVSNPIHINMNTVYAQQARQILDIIVGYKISPILWSHISYDSKNALSAGRCQTPALRIVYENDKQIKESNASIYYQTTGYFTSLHIPFILQHEFIDSIDVKQFLFQSIHFNHTISIDKPKQVIKQPPKPFTTSLLQQVASNELHFSPKETMNACQKLYESGYITYMRTDTTYYSKEFIQSANTYIIQKYGDKYVKDINKICDDNNNNNKNEKNKNIKAQEAHEAIRPTRIECIQVDKFDKNLGKREERIYSLIRRNTIESCMSNAKYITIQCHIDAPSIMISSKKIVSKYTFISEKNIFPGWKIINGIKTIEKQDKIYHHLEHLKDKSIVSYNKITSEIHMKYNKSHYTEAKLVKLLESYGIGRPSTFSSLIDKIQDRQYVKKTEIEGKKINCVDFELIKEHLKQVDREKIIGNEKNKLVLQPIGNIVIEFLLKHFSSIFDYTYTKNMEDKLDIISRGETNYKWYDLCEECLNEVDICIKNIKKEEKMIKKEIKIDDIHSFTIGRYGPVIICKNKKKDNNDIINNTNTKKNKKSADTISTFKQIKKEILDKEIDIELLKEKIQKGLYTIDDLIYDEDSKEVKGEMIGEYNNIPIYLKKGKYGKYIIYNNNNLSIRHIKNNSIEDIIELIKENEQSKSELSQIELHQDNDKSISIRNGKFGPYIYYKTKQMKKPTFINIKKCNFYKDIINYFTLYNKKEKMNDNEIDMDTDIDIDKIKKECLEFVNKKYNNS